MRAVGSHHPHVQLTGKGDIGGKPATAGDERPVFQPLDAATEHPARQAEACRKSRAAALTAATIAP